MLDFFKCISLKQGHQGEIVALHFNTEGDKLITASFDNTARVYYFT
jgi:dynein assembly factor with WDR repeat domains 1